MNGDPPEGSLPRADGADGLLGKPPSLSSIEGDGPRSVRSVPRPSPGRKGTLTGNSQNPPANTQPSQALPPIAGHGPPPVIAMPPDPDSWWEESAATTERRPIDGVNQRPHEPVKIVGASDGISPSAELQTPVPDSSPARRRSRRTVKIPSDAVPNKTPSPPAVAVVEATPVMPVAAPPAAAAPVSAPPLAPQPFIPPLPPVPAGLVRSSTPPAGAGPTPPMGVQSSADTYEVIRPMRIISIGDEAPSTAPAAPVFSAPAAALSEPPTDSDPAGVAPTPRTPSVPASALSPDDVVTRREMVTEPGFDPEATVPEVAGVAAAEARAPKPPEVEEVEAIDAEDDEAHRAPMSAPAEVVEPLEEIEPDRLSDVGPVSAEILHVEEAPKPKKPPPPPPRRQTLDPAINSNPPPSNGPASPISGPTSPISGPTTPISGPSTVPTVDLAARKRPKNWWEEIFSDDYLRTMEKVEPKAIRRECDFIEDRLGLEKGAVMLDLACGNGAHAVELASRGYNVVGYDLSLAMLARAQDEAQERGQKLNFLQGDMREMAFEEAFDGVYCWSTSFGYFDDEKNLNVLSRIHRGLRSGGLLLLDVINRDYVAPRQPSLVWFEGDGCVCMDDMVVDFFTSRLKVKRTVMFDDGRSRECDYSIRLFGLHELGKMLHECGFKVVEVTGHPAHPGVFFGSESPRIIVLAERS